jgi:hypothetical protein
MAKTRKPDLEALRRDLQRRSEEGRKFMDALDREFDAKSVLSHFHRKLFDREWDGVSTGWAIDFLAKERRAHTMEMWSKTLEELAAMLQEVDQAPKKPPVVHGRKLAKTRGRKSTVPKEIRPIIEDECRAGGDKYAVQERVVAKLERHVSLTDIVKVQRALAKQRERATKP